MCGICGKLTFDSASIVEPALIRAMLDPIRHRGPDDEGIYSSPQIGLGHRRLSIIDLNTGHQPLSNEDGTIWIVFNGEIYNFHELRAFLLAEGHVFRTQSDTEVIVHLYEQLGPSCVEKLRGMFAFAIWDEKQKLLLLARDRVGIKPLYYRLNERSLIFASEIKAILGDPDVRPEVDPTMIDRFLTFFFMPGEETLFRDIRKLAPGSYLIVRNQKVEVHQYWDLLFLERDIASREAEEELLQLLDDSVRLHMISDVPVGVLLSGGVDSTAVLGFATGKTEQALSSYTLGFDAQGVTDERPYARLAAAAYGTEHHELTISAVQFRDFLPNYVWHMEEPVCEAPAIALYYVSKLAKDYVKVLLSGEGGDEAFAGYQNYRSILWLERLKKLAGPFSGGLSDGLLGVNRGFHSEGIAKYIPLMKLPFESYYYSRTSSPHSYFNSQWNNLYTRDFAKVTDKTESLRIVGELMGRAAPYRTLNKMLYVDTKTWLADDLLLKADKMTMANSVELRVPLLDHKLLEFAASLPQNYKVRGFSTKHIVKKVLGPRVPREILERRKTGFPVPYGQWLRGEMKGWLSDILLDRETTNRGYFETKAIEGLISENWRTGRYSKELFSLAILELWHRTFLKNSSPPQPPIDVSGRELIGQQISSLSVQ